MTTSEITAYTPYISFKGRCEPCARALAAGTSSKRPCHAHTSSGSACSTLVERVECCQPGRTWPRGIARWHAWRTRCHHSCRRSRHRSRHRPALRAGDGASAASFAAGTAARRQPPPWPWPPARLRSRWSASAIPQSRRRSVTKPAAGVVTPVRRWSAALARDAISGALARVGDAISGALARVVGGTRAGVLGGMRAGVVVGGAAGGSRWP